MLIIVGVSACVIGAVIGCWVLLIANITRTRNYQQFDDEAISPSPNANRDPIDVLNDEILDINTKSAIRRNTYIGARRQWPNNTDWTSKNKRNNRLRQDNGNRIYKSKIYHNFIKLTSWYRKINKKKIKGKVSSRFKSKWRSKGSKERGDDRWRA